MGDGATGPTGPRRPSGIALVAVLWVMSLLAVIAASFMLTTRTEGHLAANLADHAAARALADAGVYRAIAGLLAADPERRWKRDGRSYALTVDGDTIVVAAQDEGGKIDLNTATPELLRGLFRSVGMDDRGADRLADAIADWRDPDDLRRAAGAEDADYRAAGLTWRTAGRPLEVVEELQQVIGVTPALYRRLAPAVTVFSKQPGIDFSTAPRAALAALPGITAAGIDAILATRDDGAGAGIAATPDYPAVVRFASRSSGGVVTIRSLGRARRDAVFVREAVVHLVAQPDQPYTFQLWRQGGGTVDETAATRIDAPAAGPERRSRPAR